MTEKKEEENVRILVPTDYEKPKSPYLIATVLAIADDCKIDCIDYGDNIIIERRMQ